MIASCTAHEHHGRDAAVKVQLRRFKCMRPCYCGTPDEWHPVEYGGVEFFHFTTVRTRITAAAIATWAATHVPATFLAYGVTRYAKHDFANALEIDTAGAIVHQKLVCVCLRVCVSVCTCLLCYCYMEYKIKNRSTLYYTLFHAAVQFHSQYSRSASYAMKGAS